jgi:hypothetical protein
MIYNKKMEKYLKYLNINSKLIKSSDRIELNILQGVNYSREPYFYIENNCCDLKIKDNLNLTGDMLTQLEWDCNEIHINDLEDSVCLIKSALNTVKSIKAILNMQYPLQSFDIVMSFDDGRQFDVLPSVTIHFYAIRNNNYISHDKSELEKYNQPILIESVN